MPFNFKCQSCKTELEAQDEWEGQKTACPNCQAEITIQKDAAPEQVQVVALPEKFIFICPECGQMTELDADQEGKQIECPNCAETVTAAPTDERPCPFCQEKIKLKAKVCKHCKKQVPPLTPSTPPVVNNAPALNPDEKICPKCQQVIKKQATFCRFCKQDIGNGASVEIGNIQVSSGSKIEEIFNKVALTIAPVISGRELQNKENVLAFVNPFMKILFWILAVLMLIGTIGNAFGLGVIGNELRGVISGAKFIFSFLGFVTVVGCFEAYKRKPIFTEVISLFMLIFPVMVFLSLLMDGTGGLIVKSLSVPGSAACGYITARMTFAMLRNKPFVFDNLNRTAFLTQITSSAIALILFPFVGGAEIAVAVLAVLFGLFLTYMISKLYLVAWMKSTWGGSDNA